MGRPPLFKTCSDQECDRPHYGKGLCKQHYNQMRLKTDPIYRAKEYARVRAVSKARSRTPEYIKAKMERAETRRKLNKDRRNEAKRFRYKNDPDFRNKHRAGVNAWTKNNMDKALAKKAKRRAAMKNATPAWMSNADFDKILLMYTKAQAMKRTDGIVYHVDHIVPLQNDMVCGLHVPWNLRVITATENIAKNNKLSDAA